jgi:23S rRNA (cytosine1962-C5)-methyltransferase
VKRFLLKPKEERRLLRGHLWAYRNEFAEPPEAEDGEVADVFSSGNRFIGRGFYQAQGGIAVRLLSRRQSSIDAGFLAKRIEAAREFRQRVFPGETVYRWVFGESDGLPGFVADRYGSAVSAETSCAFYRAHVDDLAASFLAQAGIESVRMDVCGQVSRHGVVPPWVECIVDGVRFSVDVEDGQKTGMFLDQRVNCQAARRFAPDARVLDAHCYIGMWSCHAALAGAAHVTGVDTSAQAIESARANAELNRVADRCAFECADVATLLAREERYDLVILDPPAFAKSRDQEPKALSLYKALNAAAMNALEPGGVLITSSCSHFVSAEAFLETLKRAAATVQRPVWILDVRGAGPDHPVLMAMPETAYLTCVTLRVL